MNAGQSCGMREGGGGPSMGMSGAQAAALAGVIQDASRRSTIASSAPYYSRAFLSADAVVVGADSTYTFDQGVERRAFGYAKTDAIPGFPASYGTANLATSADTNLMTKGQTLAGQTVLIQGVSCLVQPKTDFEAARQVLSECSVSIGLNGDQQTMEMGTPLNIPGIGGLFGWGFTGINVPALDAAGSSEFAKLGSNGSPDANNYRRVPEGLIWRPAGKTDGTLVIKVRQERAVTIGPVTARVAATGIQAFTPPDELVIDLMFHLVCIAISDGSVNL